MSEEVLVKVEGVSKKFCRSLKRSLWYGLQDVTGDLLGKVQQNDHLRKNEFWAINDVSFELKRGECLGLIGPNGAGKSTLLKLLNGLIKPDKGRITMRGRVGALIELGAGFNPILTARENIYINSSVLGFSKKEIDKKFDSIVDFAEIEEFIDTPIRSFSSGMKVRLGFAIAAQMEPDVLLIDEVLAVGDIGFRTKCFNTIRDIQKKSTVILVSHQMPEIARSCTLACLVADSKPIAFSANVASVIQQYYETFRSLKSTKVDTDKARIHKVRVLNEQNEEATTASHLGNLKVEIEVEINKSIEHPHFAVSFTNQNLQLILQSHTMFDDFNAVNHGNKMKVQLVLKDIPLGPGTYYLSAGIDGPVFGEILARWMDCKKIQITGDHLGFAPTIIPGHWQISSIKQNA